MIENYLISNHSNHCLLQLVSLAYHRLLLVLLLLQPMHAIVREATRDQ